MNSKLFGPFFLLVCLAASCETPPSASLPPNAKGTLLTVSLTAAQGSNAQTAVWLETADGTFLRSLYVTQAIFRLAASRPMALPVWQNRSALAVTDGVSGATPLTTLGPATVVRRVVLEPGDYLVYCEVNRSWDYNGSYTTANADPNGQPSVVYRAALKVDGTAKTVVPAFLGRGSATGGTGAVTPDSAGLTTALSLLTTSLSLD